jgi:hypothetical protein
MVRYISIEHLNPNQSIVFFLLNEKIKIDENQKMENLVIDTYNRLFFTHFAEIMPPTKFELWFLDFFSLIENQSRQNKEEIFEKIVKKSINLMLKKQNLNNLVELSNKVRYACLLYKSN